MAPGGRLLSESEIREHYPSIGDAGEELPVPPFSTVTPYWIGSMAYAYLPPAYAFPTPELVFSGAEYASGGGAVFFRSASYTGGGVPKIDNVWTNIAPVGEPYKMDVLWNATNNWYIGAVRLTNSTLYQNRFYSTLPDAAGTGPDYQTLLHVTQPSAPLDVYIPKSTDPANPSYAVTMAQTQRVYQFWAPTVLIPPSGRVAQGGTMRISTMSGPLKDANVYWTEAPGLPQFMHQNGAETPKKTPFISFGTSLVGIPTASGWSLNLTRVSSEPGLATVAVYLHPNIDPPLVGWSSDPDQFNPSTSYVFIVPVANLPLGASATIPIPAAGLMDRLQSGSSHSFSFAGLTSTSAWCDVDIADWSINSPAGVTWP